MTDVTRRDFLKAAGTAAAAALAATGGVAGLPILERIAEAKDKAPAKKKTEHVVFVALAGGVRTKETFLQKDNVPNLIRVAEEGVLFPRVSTRNVGHYGALLSLFTGCVEVTGIRENTRGKNPTLFEYLRKAKGFRADEVWISTAGGPQQANLAYSLDSRYGAAYGASVIDSEGVFNHEFKSLLQQFGQPKPTNEGEETIRTRLHQALAEGNPAIAKATAAAGASDPEAVRKVERFILDELRGQTAKLTGPGARDAKSIRIGSTILQVFKPKVLGISLQNADIAHGSFNGYVVVIRRNDEELGRLMDGIRGDPDLKDSTTVIVCPEFGRDKDLNQRNGLDHGDNSDELLRVAMVAWGPDFKKARKVDREIDWVDLAPTVCALFGAKAEGAEGKPIKELLL